jgi:Stress responsive A/B Barrel Domain
MITHTVLFRLNRPVSEHDRDRLVGALRDFATDPPFATGPAHVDSSLGLRGESPRTADALLQVQFPDAGVFPQYIEHERHQALVTGVLEPLCEGWWSVQAET